MKLYKQIICTVFIILVNTAVFATEIGDKVYMEVEIDGDKVGKWVTFCSISEYDVNGWLIYKNSFNEETRYERDKYGSKIYQKLPDGSETWFEPKYDKNNKLIYRKDSKGTEEWFEYDKNGNLLHYKKSDGDEVWYEYDSKGNCIHTKKSDGDETWTEYDNKGREIYSKWAYGREEWSKYYKTGGNAYQIIEVNSPGYNYTIVYIYKYEFYEDGKTQKKIMMYAYDKH